MPAKLELYFSGAPIPQLLKTVFVSSCPSERLVACRGQATGVFQKDSFIGQFVWSNPLKAAVVLLLRAAGNARSAFRRKELATLEGGFNTLAASLDHAVSREPNWLLDMFGVSAKGESNTKCIFRRTSSETRCGRIVLLSVDQDFLAGEHISVFIDGAEVFSSGAIFELAQCIEAEQPEEPTQSSSSSCSNKLEHSSDLTMACLSMSVHVVILNAQGDAEISFRKKVENLGAENITSAAIEVWLDTPYSKFQVDAWDGAGQAAPVIAINNDDLYKRLKINFPQPIPAFQKGGYSFRYVVQKLFEGPLNWWSLRVREPTARLKLEILDTRFRTLENQFTLHQAEDGHIVDDVVKHSITGSNRGVTISWTSDYPPTGHLFKTYWVGRDPMHVSLPETAPYRSGEATTIALC